MYKKARVPGSYQALKEEEGEMMEERGWREEGERGRRERSIIYIL